MILLVQDKIGHITFDCTFMPELKKYFEVIKHITQCFYMCIGGAPFISRITFSAVYYNGTCRHWGGSIKTISLCNLTILRREAEKESLKFQESKIMREENHSLCLLLSDSQNYLLLLTGALYKLLSLLLYFKHSSVTSTYRWAELDSWVLLESKKQKLFTLKISWLPWPVWWFGVSDQ